MNLNYVLVWPSGPGYTSRIRCDAHWGNQGVRLLEWTLTLLIPRLRSQRFESCILCFMYLCILSCAQITLNSCMTDRIVPFWLSGGSSEEGKQVGVMVEFDDGDRGKISLPNIRLLPPGYQIQCKLLCSVIWNAPFLINPALSHCK